MRATMYPVYNTGFKSAINSIKRNCFVKTKNNEHIISLTIYQHIGVSSTCILLVMFALPANMKYVCKTCSFNQSALKIRGELISACDWMKECDDSDESLEDALRRLSH